jgi:hypothetical protein
LVFKSVAVDIVLPCRQEAKQWDEPPSIAKYLAMLNGVSVTKYFGGEGVGRKKLWRRDFFFLPHLGGHQWCNNLDDDALLKRQSNSPLLPEVLVRVLRR